MDMKRSFVCTLLVICSTLVFLTCANAASLDVSIATAYPTDNFHTVNLQHFATKVAKATNGQVNFKIHPNATLLKAGDIFSGVQTGKAGGGEVIMSSLAKESPIFGIDALPFIVSGYDDAQFMWNASRESVEKALAERGLQLLYAVPWPPQNIYSNHAIAATRDFKGLRMRTFSPATVRIAELIGAKPVTIQVVDLANAISGDQFDMMLTSSWTGVETKAWTKMRYYYRANVLIPKNMVFVSKKVFDQLDEETKKSVLQLAQEAEQNGWKMSKESDRSFENQLAANRIIISTLDPFIRRYLDRVGETLTREWLKQAGGDELLVLLKYTTARSAR